MNRVSVCATLLVAPLAAANITCAEPALQEVRRIELAGVKGRIDHISADLAGQRLFVAALENESVEVVDVESGAALASLKGFKGPQGILVLAERRRLIVASGAADHASVVGQRVVLAAG